MWCVTCSTREPKPDLVDSNGRKPLDLVGAATAPPAAGPSAEQIRALLQRVSPQRATGNR